jgi:hypothetical protein
MKVTYRASFDEFIAKQERIQNFYYVLFGLNLFVAPAFLIFVDKIWFAIPLFIANLFLLFALNQIQRNLSRTYYLECFPNLETTDTTVEVSTEGLTCSYEGFATFVPWTNISSVDGNTIDVSFITTPYCLYVPRRAFDDDEHFVAFVNEARAFKEGSANEHNAER